LLAFYLTLRELEIRPLPASLGAVMLLCNPVLFMLSHSFMTDVPFVSVMNGSLLFYVRWTKRGHTHDLALGSALAVVAFLIRQLGAALALAPIGYVLLMRLVGGPRRILTWPQRLCLLMPGWGSRWGGYAGCMGRPVFTRRGSRISALSGPRPDGSICGSSCTSSCISDLSFGRSHWERSRVC